MLQGCNLLEIESQTGGRLMVSDTGEVDVYAPTRQQYDHVVLAIQEVEGKSIQAGEVYRVKVRLYCSQSVLQLDSTAHTDRALLMMTGAMRISALVVQDIATCDSHPACKHTCIVLHATYCFLHGSFGLTSMRP